MAQVHHRASHHEHSQPGGCGRKRDHALLTSGLDEVKEKLRESGERLLRSIGPAGPQA
ncbi:hypothetical protein ACFWIJ_00160 [Streptomyces sp. NPDC127079]|uniref:hypothetical protein n=1 Tax=Streptomyces sp. NPDC127079 TaxID=3347132 RepID=UPI0036617234